jgi:hypothetical protein
MMEKVFTVVFKLGHAYDIAAAFVQKSIDRCVFGV